MDLQVVVPVVGGAATLLGTLAGPFLQRQWRHRDARKAARRAWGAELLDSNREVACFSDGIS